MAHVICPGVLVSRVLPYLVALLYEPRDQCSLVPADNPFFSVGGNGPPLIFTLEPLEIPFKCGTNVYFDVFLGLNIFNVLRGCRIESATFTFFCS